MVIILAMNQKKKKKDGSDNFKNKIALSVRKHLKLFPDFSPTSNRDLEIP